MIRYWQPESLPDVLPPSLPFYPHPYPFVFVFAPASGDRRLFFPQPKLKQREEFS